MLAQVSKHRPAPPGSRADRRTDVPARPGARDSTWCFSARSRVATRKSYGKQLLGVVRAEGGPDRVNQPGGVFVLKAAVMQDDEKILLQAAARVVLVGDRGSLASQLDRTEWRHPLPGPLPISSERVKRDDEPMRLPGGSVVRQRPGRFHAGRPGILCADLRSRPAAQKRKRSAQAHRRSFIRASPPPPGSTSSPTPSSVSSSPRAGSGLPGPGTARRTD